MRIKKKDLTEAKFVMKPDDYKKVKDELTADDSVTIIDEDDVETPKKDKEGDIVSDKEAMYVAYEKEYSDEAPFKIGNQKFEYCWGKYPSGKVDIAVYAYEGDVTYGFYWWRKTYLKESVKPIISKGDLIKFINENK